MALFEEIYGSYFQAVRKILEEAACAPLTEREMESLVRSLAFEESAQVIVPKLTKGAWSSLLRPASQGAKAWGSALQSRQLKSPLTSLQKSWLKTLLADRRFRFFFTDAELAQLSAELADVPALCSPSDFHCFDRYLDGDDYGDPLYREIFQTVLQALKEKRSLLIAYESGKGRSLTLEVLPCLLQYSPKDDKFRLLSREYGRGRPGRSLTLNLARIRACHLSRRRAPARFDRDFPYGRQTARPPVRIRIQNERNALERCMLHFAHYDKQTAYEEETDTWLCSIWYDPADETELLIELLFFGPVIHVLGPKDFLAKIKERIIRQRKLLQETQ